MSGFQARVGVVSAPKIDPLTADFVGGPSARIPDPLARLAASTSELSQLRMSPITADLLAANQRQLEISERARNIVGFSLFADDPELAEVAAEAEIESLDLTGLVDDPGLSNHDANNSAVLYGEMLDHVDTADPVEPLEIVGPGTALLENGVLVSAAPMAEIPDDAIEPLVSEPEFGANFGVMQGEPVDPAASGASAAQLEATMRARKLAQETLGHETAQVHDIAPRQAAAQAASEVAEELEDEDSYSYLFAIGGEGMDNGRRTALETMLTAAIRAVAKEKRFKESQKDRGPASWLDPYRAKNGDSAINKKTPILTLNFKEGQAHQVVLEQIAFPDFAMEDDAYFARQVLHDGLLAWAVKQKEEESGSSQVRYLVLDTGQAKVAGDFQKLIEKDAEGELHLIFIEHQLFIDQAEMHGYHDIFVAKEVKKDLERIKAEEEAAVQAFERAKEAQERALHRGRMVDGKELKVAAVDQGFRTAPFNRIVTYYSIDRAKVQERMREIEQAYGEVKAG
ncbi:MAG: hypothetical protein ABH823_03495 [bacterium]